MSKSSRGTLKTGASTDRHKPVNVSFRADILVASIRESIARRTRLREMELAQTRRITVAKNSEGRTVLRIKPNVASSSSNPDDMVQDADDEKKQEEEEEEKKKKKKQEEEEEKQQEKKKKKQEEEEEKESESETESESDYGDNANMDTFNANYDGPVNHSSNSNDEGVEHGAEVEQAQPSANPEVVTEEVAIAFNNSVVHGLAAYPEVGGTDDGEQHNRSAAPSPEPHRLPALACGSRSRSPSPIPSLLPRTNPMPSDVDLGLDFGSLSIAHNKPAGSDPTELDMEMSSLSLAPESPRSALPSTEQQSAGVDTDVAFLSITPPRPPRSPKRPPPPPFESEAKATATNSDVPSIVITPPPPVARSPLLSSATLIRPSVFSIPTPVVSRAIPARTTISTPPTAPSASATLPALHVAPCTLPAPITRPVLPVPVAPNVTFNNSIRLSAEQNALMLRAPLAPAASQVESMDVEPIMQGQEGWPFAHSWNAPPTQISSQHMTLVQTSLVNTFHDIDMQDDALSSQPACTSQWPTAIVYSQASPQPVVTGQSQAFAGQVQPQAFVPQQPSADPFNSSGGVIPSAVSAPGGDVCVDIQVDEEKPKSVHRIPWTHRRGLAAREACQALAKQPSKKAFRLRARRRHNFTHYLPVIVPSQFGVAHARVLKVADRRRTPYAQAQVVRTRHKCDQECLTARALLTRAWRKNHGAHTELEQDIQMANTAPAPTIQPAENEVPASTSATIEPVAATADVPNFLDLAFMEEDSAMPVVPSATNTSQGVSETVSADKVAGGTSQTQEGQGDARGTQEHTRRDNTGKEQDSAQNLISADALMAMLLKSTQTLQESPADDTTTSGQGVTKVVSNETSGQTPCPALPEAIAPKEAPQTPAARPAQVGLKPLHSCPSALGDTKSVPKSVVEASAKSTPAFARLAPRRGTNTCSSIRLADATVVVASSPGLSESLDNTPSCPAASVSDTPKSAFVSAPDIKNSTLPLAALPFSLRPSILPNVATSISLPPVKVTPVTKPPTQTSSESSIAAANIPPAPIAILAAAATIPATAAAATITPTAAAISPAPATISPTITSSAATAIHLHSTPTAHAPASSALTTVNDSAAATANSVSFHESLSRLPPVSHIPLPLEVPETKHSRRRPPRFNIRLEPMSFQKPVVLLPRPFVVPSHYNTTPPLPIPQYFSIPQAPTPQYHIPRAPSPQYCIPKTPTEDGFDVEHHVWVMDAEEEEEEEEEAIRIAGLSSCSNPYQSTRSARSSTPTYNTETEEHGVPVMPGYHADLYTCSDSDTSSDGADGMSLFGSDDGDLDDEPDDQSSASSGSEMGSTVTMVAGGAGYLAGSAVKAVLVGVRSVTGWWSRWNKVQK